MGNERLDDDVHALAPLIATVIVAASFGAAAWWVLGPVVGM